jgi:hypothetical protein
VSLDTLKVVTKLAVWDPSDDLISLIHRIIESFENEQCPIKEALLLITSCGHPKLDFQAIKSLCRKIDVTGNLLRKLQKKHQEAEDLLFKDITSYFTRIPNQINVSLANELLKTLPRFLKRLVPAQIEFLCRMPHFWAIIADKHIRSATTEFSVESLRTMAEFLSYHPQQDIRPLNFILETLDVSDPLLKEKLMALASSGHPELNENLLVAKAKELDKPSSGKDKIKECIQKTYKAAEKDKKQKKWVLLSSSSSAIKC